MMIRIVAIWCAFVSFKLFAQHGRYYDEDSNGISGILEFWWMIAIVIVVVAVVRSNRNEKRQKGILKSEQKEESNGKFYRFLIFNSNTPYDDVWFRRDCYGTNVKQAYSRLLLEDEEVTKHCEVLMIKEMPKGEDFFRRRLMRLGNAEFDVSDVIVLLDSGWKPSGHSSKLIGLVPDVVSKHGIHFM